MSDSPWSRYSLVLVDLQNDFWAEAVAATAPELPDRVAALLAYARAEGLAVVHVRARFRPDGRDWMARYRLRNWIPCVDGTPGVETLPFAAELPGEPVVTKQSFDGFLGTDLDEVLAGRGIRGRLDRRVRHLHLCALHRLDGDPARIPRFGGDGLCSAAEDLHPRRWRHTRSCSARCALTRLLNDERGGTPTWTGWTPRQLPDGGPGDTGRRLSRGTSACRRRGGPSASRRRSRRARRHRRASRLLE